MDEVPEHMKTTGQGERGNDSIIQEWTKIGAEVKTSLLRRLQAQALPDATQPIGKIHPFNKIAVTL